MKFPCSSGAFILQLLHDVAHFPFLLQGGVEIHKFITSFIGFVFSKCKPKLFYIRISINFSFLRTYLCICFNMVFTAHTWHHLALPILVTIVGLPPRRHCPSSRHHLPCCNCHPSLSFPIAAFPSAIGVAVHEATTCTPERSKVIRPSRRKVSFPISRSFLSVL